MSKYKEYTVRYLLDEYEQQQLKKIYEAYKSMGYNFQSTEIFFETIMTAGSIFYIAKKLADEEWMAGISEYKTYDEVSQETKERLDKRKQAKEHPIETAMEERIDAAIDEVMEQSPVMEPDMEPEL